MYGLDLIRQTKFDIIALISYYLIMGVSLYLACAFGHADWFSRSGSVMVIFGVMSEYQNINLQQQINLRAPSSGETEQPRYRQILLKIIHFSVLFGTFIWGYGDMLIPCKT